MKEELLKAADKGAVTMDKFKKFNDDLPMLGDKMVQAGLCNYYDIICVGGSLLTLRLNVKPIHFNEISEDVKCKAQSLFDDFLDEHQITKDECEVTNSYAYVMWSAFDSVDEDKFRKYNESLHLLGDKFVNDGVCKAYKVTRSSDKMNTLELDIRPVKRGNLPMGVCRRANKELDDFMFSFGITYEESEEYCFGIKWLMEGTPNG